MAVGDVAFGCSRLAHELELQGTAGTAGDCRPPMSDSYIVSGLFTLVNPEPQTGKPLNPYVSLIESWAEFSKHRPFDTIEG